MFQKYLRNSTEKVIQAINIGTMELANFQQPIFTPEFILLGLLEQEDSGILRMLEELEMAYAITVHKSQGSEYPIVIIPLGSTAPMLLSRNLLYTAVTRAQSMVILVGREEILRTMVENNRQSMRYTGLVFWLGEAES